MLEGKKLFFMPLLLSFHVIQMMTQFFSPNHNVFDKFCNLLNINPQSFLYQHGWFSMFMPLLTKIVSEWSIKLEFRQGNKNPSQYKLRICHDFCWSCSVHYPSKGTIKGGPRKNYQKKAVNQVSPYQVI